ncbi:MAG: GLUG motif-containing protein [Melioribacteraceae bacterium]
MNIIDLNVAPYNTGIGWIPIGNRSYNFKGNYDGNGHVIDHLYINNPNVSYQGLFYCTEGGTIQNLGLTNVNVYGKEYVGALIALTAQTSITNCYSTGIVRGMSYVGGLIGNSYSIVSKCFSTCSVNGSIYIGGLIGLLSYNSVSNCYSTGNVTGVSYNVGGLIGRILSGSVSNCYSNGIVSLVPLYCGGLIGGNNDGSITNSFWDKTVNSNSSFNNGLGIGKTTSEMKTNTTFSSAGWDFSIWNIELATNNGYPFLAWQNPLIEQSIYLSGGWNMISMPVKVPDMITTKTFPNALSSVYEFKNGYKAIDTLKLGNGYWVKYDSTTKIIVKGEPAGLNSISGLKSGWNMIGGYDKDLAVNGLSTTPNNIVISNYYGYSKQSGYISTDTLKKGQGYWIKLNQDGVINLTNPNGSSSSLLSKLNEDKKIDYNEGVRFNVADAQGRGSELILTNSTRTLNNYDLPPLPPQGICDLRWAGDRSVKMWGDGKSEMLISSAEYPVIIRVTGGDVIIKDNLGGRLLNQIVKSGGILRISDSAIERLEIENLILPTEFALMQNYPNPFNPSTTIKYELPTNSLVTIKVYDIIGKEIATLINANKTAGAHEVKFDGSSLSSGIYIYKIQAGNYLQTKKMILMK